MLTEFDQPVAVTDEPAPCVDPACFWCNGLARLVAGVPR